MLYALGQFAATGMLLCVFAVFLFAFFELLLDGESRTRRGIILSMVFLTVTMGLCLFFVWG